MTTLVNLLNKPITLQKIDGTLEELPAYTGDQILVIVDSTADPINNMPVLTKHMATTPVPTLLLAGVPAEPLLNRRAA